MSRLGLFYFITMVLLYSNSFLHFSHRLTGWNAVKSRVEQLGLDLTDAEVHTLFFLSPFNFLLVPFLFKDQGRHLQDQGTR